MCRRWWGCSCAPSGLEGFLGIDIVPARLAFQAVARLGPFDDRRLARALYHHAVGGQRQRRFKQSRRIQVITDQGPEHTHFLLHQGAFVPVRKHRIKVDHLGRFTLPLAHVFNGVARQQAHACHDRPDLVVTAGPRQPVLEQRCNQRLALDQGHLTAQAGQHEGVLAQPCRAVEHLRPYPLGDAHGLGDHLPVATPKQTPVRGLTFDEVHAHWARRLRAQLLDLQAIGADLHGKSGVGVDQRQPQALCPFTGLGLKFRRQRLDPDAAYLLLLVHQFTHSKKIQEIPGLGRYLQYPLLCQSPTPATAMTDTLPLGSAYLSPVGDYGRHNTQALGGVSHLWQDFFARALAEQQGDEADNAVQAVAQYDKVSGEPIGGARVLAQINTQRLCQVLDTVVAPPEPLFLPKAEFEMNLLDPAPEPFSTVELLEQQRQLDLNNSWLRPVVMGQGQAPAEPGPGPVPRALYLPIAEFEMDLLDRAPQPFDEPTLAAQQSALDFDNHWARPVVLNNVRAHA